MVINGRNQNIVKEINRTLIIEEVISAGELSRSELAQRLNLSNPSVSKHVEALISKGVLIEIGAKKTVVGRRPIILRFNSSYGCVAVMDFSQKEARICLSDLAGDKKELAYIENVDSLTYELIEGAEQVLHEMLARAGAKFGKLLGISVVVPGTVSSVTGEIRFGASTQELRASELCAMIKRSFGVYVCVENASSLAAVGESLHGAGEAGKSILYLGIDRSLGLGLMLDGSVYEGVSSTACDISSILAFETAESRVVTPTELFGMESLVGMAARLFENAPDCVLCRWTTAQELTGEDIIRACSVGDKAVISVVKEFAAKIAVLCHDMCCLFDTELIIVGGMAAKLSDVFFDELQSRYIALPGHSSSCELRLAKNPDDAVLLGAIDTLVHEVLRLNLTDD